MFLLLLFFAPNLTEAAQTKRETHYPKPFTRAVKKVFKVACVILITIGFAGVAITASALTPFVAFAFVSTALVGVSLGVIGWGKWIAHRKFR